jgi:hypothetical protein
MYVQLLLTFMANTCVKMANNRIQCECHHKKSSAYTTAVRQLAGRTFSHDHEHVSPARDNALRKLMGNVERLNEGVSRIHSVQIVSKLLGAESRHNHHCTLLLWTSLRLSHISNSVSTFSSAMWPCWKPTAVPVRPVLSLCWLRWVILTARAVVMWLPCTWTLQEMAGASMPWFHLQLLLPQ